MISASESLDVSVSVKDISSRNHDLFQESTND